MPMMLLALLEFGLYIGHRTLGLGSLSLLVPSVKEQLVYQPYLAEPDCTRIAIFGGSNVRGFGGELSAPMIIEHELAKQPGCFFVKNIADSGAYLTGHGDLLIESLESFYDHILIYSGHNEIHSLIDEVGYVEILTDEMGGNRQHWRDIRDRQLKVHTHPGESGLASRNALISRIPYSLASRSRVVAVLERFARNPEDYLNRIREVLLGGWIAEAGESRFPDVIEQQSIVHGVDTIPSRYRSSLTRLDPQQVLISTVSGNLFFPPSWSVGTGKNAHYFFDLAVSEYTKTNEINWKYFELANSLDGFPTRVLDGVNHAIRTSGLQFIDFDRTIKSRIELGDRFSAYFSDMHHLNNVGHILLGREFLCGLGYRDYCSSVDLETLSEMEENYLRAFYANWNLQQEREHNASKNFFWSYKMSAFSSCPLCVIRFSMSPAAILLESDYWRYEEFISSLQDRKKYSELTGDSIYEFINFFKENPITRRATQEFFVGSLPKLNLCLVGEEIMNCLNRTTKNYQRWRW